MSTQMKPDSDIPLQIYELASKHRVGTPLKKQNRRSIQIVLLFGLLIGIVLIGWLGYTIYGYIAFSILSHTYPNVDSVPDKQLDNYFWLQSIHDQFWMNVLQIAVFLLGLVSRYATFSSAYRTKLYVCTDGLLKVYKKTDEGVRWDEVKEFFIPNGKATRLIKQDDTGFNLPPLLLSGRGKVLNTLIIDELTHFLLPEMLASYKRGETVTFGDLKVNQKGIYLSGGSMVYWEKIGGIALEEQNISVYYSEPGNKQEKEEQLPPVFAGKWHTLRQSMLASLPWPNLPIFVTMVDTLLDQHGVNQIQTALRDQQPQTLKEIAAQMKRRDKKRKRVIIATGIVSFLAILSLVVGFIIYQSVQEQQQVDKDTQHIQSYFSQLAHKTYSVQIPGEHCGNGKNFWLDDDSKDVYTCQTNGLLMTQKDMQYGDAEWFTFVPDTLSTMNDFSSINYFPHNYRVQVKATILSGGPGTCVAVRVHTQHFQGNQSFDICADGSWAYYRCDLDCHAYTQITSGTLARSNKSFLIAVDVTDDILSLSVDGTKIGAVYDNTYTSTNQLELVLYGSQDAHEPITALFSDFSYTPSP